MKMKKDAAYHGFVFYIVLLSAVTVMGSPKRKVRQEYSRVLVLYTGGTIGMKQNDKGELQPVPNLLTDSMKNNSMLNDPEHPSGIEKDFLILPFLGGDPALSANPNRILYKVEEYENLIDSSDITVNAWSQIASDIQKNYNDYDGFVILHGTDTLAYTASALAFMLENLTKPVVLTGAQLPVWNILTDGWSNIQLALLTAGGAVRGLSEVVLAFDRQLLRGCRASKVSSRYMNAFVVPKAQPLAHYNVNGFSVNMKDLRPQPQGDLNLNKFSDSVGILYFHPGIAARVIKDTVNIYKGVVLVVFGSGNICSSCEDVVEALTAAVRKDVILVAVSAVADGMVRSGAYAAGAALGAAGVLSGRDLTVEAAYTKLCFVLGQDWSIKTKKEMMVTNLRGEMED